jgi:hypothetical protein
MKHAFRICVAFAIAASACTRSKTPVQPSATALEADTSATASVTVPRPLTPAAGAVVRNIDQPMTLTVGNAVVTQNNTPTYTFEVASDSSFVTKVYTKSGVPQGANGQTSLTIDRIGAGADYYWRARAEGGGTTGPFSAARKVTVGPAIVINGVTNVGGPVNGASTGSLVQFFVGNASTSGPVGQLSYRFEISTTPSFGSLVLAGSVPQGNTLTVWTPNVELPAETTLYWHVTVTDTTNGVSSPTSATYSFTTALAIDLKKVTYLNSPDVSNWPRTATLRLVEQDGGGDGPVCMDYSDPGWPDSHWPFGGDDPNFGVYANQWYFARINGRWYGGAGEWIYRGASSCKAGQGTFTIGPDSGFGPPFSTWVPKVGELVGFMVSSVARNGPVRRTVDERSNVIVQPWRDSSR